MARALVGRLARQDLPLTDEPGDMAPPAKLVTPAEPGKGPHRAGPEWQKETIQRSSGFLRLEPRRLGRCT